MKRNKKRQRNHQQLFVHNSNKFNISLLLICSKLQAISGFIYVTFFLAVPQIQVKCHDKVKECFKRLAGRAERRDKVKRLLDTLTVRLHSTFAKVKGKSSCNASSIARRSEYLPAYQWRWSYCAAFGTMPTKSNNAYRHLNHRQWNFGHFFVLRLVKVSACKKPWEKADFTIHLHEKNLKFRNLNGTPNKPLCCTPSASMQFRCNLFIKV